jgi:hypothetical protein
VVENQKRVAWVLGAGFSRSLGGPLLDDMFSRRTGEETRLKFRSLQTDAHLALYQKYLDHRRPESGYVLWKHAEEFIDYIDTARKAGPRYDLVAREISQDIEGLYFRCVQAIAAENSFASDGDLQSEPWLPYVDWAKSLSGRDSIITFNYDLVLERLGGHPEVKAVGRDTVYGLDPAIDDPRDFATIYKLHGSIDWKRSLAPAGPIVRAQEPENLLDSPALILIASPGPTKKLHRDGPLKRIWDQALLELTQADAIVFCGYRFPPSDSESRRLLLKAIRKNDQKYLRIHIVLGQPDATSLPAIERLKSLLESVLSGRRAEGPPGKERERYFEVIVHPLYAEDFLSVMNRASITDVTYPPYAAG